MRTAGLEMSVPAQTFTCEVEVRWADLDLLAHVNNAKYFEYAMEARVRFYRHVLPEATPVVLRKTDCEFLHQVVVESGPLTVEVSVTQIGNTSYTLRHVMRDNEGRECAIAHAVMVAIDPATQRPRPVSDAERAAFSSYLSS